MGLNSEPRLLCTLGTLALAEGSIGLQAGDRNWIPRHQIERGVGSSLKVGRPHRVDDVRRAQPVDDIGNGPPYHSRIRRQNA